MIVDDDFQTRKMLQYALELNGYEVIVVRNGLRLIATLHVDKPDLILLDVVMAWINGFELCKTVKATDEFRNIPIVFISGKVDGGSIKNGYESGASHFFTKPFNINEVISKIDELLN